MPWALLAAIHYRESNFNTVASWVGGAFQFDPPLTATQVRAYGAKYGITDLTSPETDVRTGALCSAAFLQSKAAVLARLLTPDSPDKMIADVAFSYNGRAAGYWRRSSYVANDPQNGVQLRIVGTVPDEHDPSIRVRINQPDTRPGMMAVIRELRARVTVPTATPVAVPVVVPATPIVIAPTPSDPVSSAPGAGLGRVLLADQAGKFGLAPADDFVYRGMFYSRKPNGDLWVRPATAEERG